MTDELFGPAGAPDPAPPARRRVPTRWALLAAGAAVVVAGGAFYAGRTTAPTGPATLAAAVTQAQQGKLPCGDSNGAGNRFLTALCQGGGAGGFGGGAGGAGGAGTGGGGRFGGRFGGGGGALGELFGPGSVVGTVTSLGGGKLTLQTRAGDVEIVLPAGVKVTKSTTGSAGDLTQGSTVIVTSSTDADGNRTAQTVFVVTR